MNGHKNCELTEDKLYCKIHDVHLDWGKQYYQEIQEKDVPP